MLTAAAAGDQLEALSVERNTPVCCKPTYRLLVAIGSIANAVTGFPRRPVMAIAQLAPSVVL